MLVESIEHAEDDVTERFVREWRVEGDRILASLESAFQLDGELLSPDERAKIDERAAGLREAMAGTDYLAVKAWIRVGGRGLEGVRRAAHEQARREGDGGSPRRRVRRDPLRAPARHGIEGRRPRELGAVMPKVTFLPDGKSAEVAARGLAPRRRRGAPAWTCRSNCGGVCACTTCHVWVEARARLALGDRGPGGRQAPGGGGALAALAARLPGPRRGAGRPRARPGQPDQGMSDSSPSPSCGPSFAEARS